MIGHLKIFFLNGKEIDNKISFHKKFGELISTKDFVNYYGNNLDALWDVMTCGAGLNCELHWKDSDVSKVNLGDDYFYKIIDTLREVEEYQENLCVKYRQFKDDEPFKFFLE